jgi:hypothetical protein
MAIALLLFARGKKLAISTSLHPFFNLADRVDVRDWWERQGNIDPIHKLHQFSTEVLLSPGDERQVYVFIDEIDSLLSLNFPSDEFFAWIRHCYNLRACEGQFNL